MSRVVRGECNQCGECCRLLNVPIPPGFRPWVIGGEAILPMWRMKAWQWEFYQVRGAHTIDVLLQPGLKAMLIPVDPLIAPFELGFQGLSLLPQQLPIGVYRGWPVAILRSTCPHLKGRDCDLHPDGKPQACREWPNPYDDLSSTPSCGYRIEEETEEVR